MIRHIDCLHRYMKHVTARVIISHMPISVTANIIESIIGSTKKYYLVTVLYIYTYIFHYE